MKKLWIIVFIFASEVCLAQSTNISTFFQSNVKKADQFFEDFAYRNALEIYLHVFEKNPDNYHVRERIAMCYFKLHDPVSAELWYSSLAKEPDIHPEAKFEYAEALSMNGKYLESRQWFERYLKDKPNDPIARDKLAFLKSISKYQEDRHRFVVSTVDFNTDHSEYGAHFFHNGVVFASSRDLDLFIKHKPFDALYPHETLLNLYFVERKITGEWEEFVPFHRDHLKTIYHEGPIAFYDNYRKGAFTQSNLQNGKPVYDARGKLNLRIYFAEIGHLGEFAHVAPFEFNNDGYSTAHPSFTPDGKTMYFSSTAATGYGESDIYYSTFENGKWTEPANLGPGINTREDESFPFIANDTTLYFSSNGHGTLGGLDIYICYKRKGKFTNPINLGVPVNSRFDDFSLVADSTCRVGFIASNRPGGKGLDDIYSYIANYYFLAGEVRELSRAQERIPNAKIIAYNSNGDAVDSTYSDSLGYYSLNLPFDQDFKLRGEKEGYETLEDLAYSTRGKPFGVDSLLLPMWKQKLFAKGRVFSNETQALLPGATVILQNLSDGVSDTVVVNDKSEYTFLVRPNKKYRIEGSKEGYIPDGFNLDTKGLYEGDLLNDIVLEEIFINKEEVLFDFDKAEIKSEAARQMDKILRTLNRYPKSTLNIAAHADSRGTFNYNKTLSGKRAKAIVDYFVSKGIKRSRIEAAWFGEELILNRCSDGVECSEEEHSKNRRGEIKVQKTPID